jgi:ribonuclease HI
VLNTDAAIRGANLSTETPRRGTAAIGFIVKDEDGVTLRRGGLRLIETASVTEAEYSGLIAGLHNCWLLGATHVSVIMDSQLVIKQMTGVWMTRIPRIKEYREEARKEAARFEHVSYRWMRRRHNAEADGLANAYLDGT